MNLEQLSLSCLFYNSSSKQHSEQKKNILYYCYHTYYLYSSYFFILTQLTYMYCGLELLRILFLSKFISIYFRVLLDYVNNDAHVDWYNTVYIFPQLGTLLHALYFIYLSLNPYCCFHVVLYFNIIRLHHLLMIAFLYNSTSKNMQ